MSCLEFGAYGVGVDGERLEALREFARLLGLCFQIKDDIFDYFSDEKVGKPTGNDLREGKVTLPLLHALAQTHRPENARMVELARKDSLESPEIQELIAYAKTCGGIEYAYLTMQRLRDEAVRQLDIFPPSEIRAAFVSLIDFIITREHCPPPQRPMPTPHSSGPPPRIHSSTPAKTPDFFLEIRTISITFAQT